HRRELELANLGHDAEAIRATTAAQLATRHPLAAATFDRFLDLVGRPGRRLTLGSSDHGRDVK
ncbi:MAG: hypothetical protein H7A15_07105, partial [Sinobacteraceae bacterium]|nr:hypothetical protein [Nevskiaceae bacterium]